MTRQGIIGLDAGTSIVKAVLIDLAGQEHEQETIRNPVVRPRAGWVEQDMDTTWEKVRDVLRNLLSRIKPIEIVAIGVTGQGDGTWLVGEDGRPVRPAILWLDGRAGSLVELWRADGRAQRCLEITGTVPNPCLMSLQLAWLMDHEPEALRVSRWALHAKDWIFYKLTGEVFSDPSDMAHTFCDIRTLEYSDILLDSLGLGRIKRLLPQLRRSIDNKGVLARAVAEDLGLPYGLPVTAGPFDVAAAAVGLGCIQPGQVCTILGSAGIHEMVLDSTALEPWQTGYTIAHGVAGRWLRLISNMAMTINLDWFLDHLGEPDRTEALRRGKDVYELLENKLSAIPPASGGVLYLPYIDVAGERGPFVKPTARAQFFGLSTDISRYHLLRAVYEGLCYAARHCYQYFPMPFSEVRVAGGGARSKFWVQLLADVSGKTMVLCDGSEFGARGAAMVAGVSTGIFASFEDAVTQWVRARDQVSPNPAASRLYAGWFKLYQTLIERNWDLWDLRKDLLQQGV